jgi:hypothetical protein
VDTLATTWLGGDVAGLLTPLPRKSILGFFDDNALDHLVQPEFPVDCFDLRRLDQFAMRDAHGMQRALELLLPEGQEAVQFGKFGEQIVVLPDIGLEQPAMIGPPV